MNRRTASMVATAVLISVVAILIGWQVGRSRRAPEETPTLDAMTPQPADGPTTSVKLYFAGHDRQLHSEQREIPVQKDLVTHLGRVVEELLAGPVSEDFLPALPPGMTASWVHINEAGVVYVDLQFAGEGPFPAWGSRHEMLAVFSVVNSLFANTPEITSVVLLRDGQQEPTFAGHLDTSRPLHANTQLVATQ
jgi:hypothetical protein